MAVIVLHLVLLSAEEFIYKLGEILFHVAVPVALHRSVRLLCVSGARSIWDTSLIPSVLQRCGNRQLRSSSLGYWYCCSYIRNPLMFGIMLIILFQ